MMRVTAIAGLAVMLTGAVRAQDWKVQTSGLDTNLRGVSAAWTEIEGKKPETVAWAAGSNGVVLRSTDDGKTWKRMHVPEGDGLDFRGVQAINQKTAYLMASGEGEKSRIYKTTDQGANWELQYTDKRKEFFLDAIVCESETKCFALGDPMDGKFVLLKTEDGKHWAQMPTDQMPTTLKGEGAFAGSNTALALGEGEDLFFGTGGANPARVFYSPNSGQTWSTFDTPILAGTASAGIFSIEAKEGKTVVVAGGDYKLAEQARDVAAYSLSKGEKWALAASQPGGFRSAVASVDGTLFVAVGPNGTDISFDAGKTWKKSDDLNLNAVCVLDIFHVWAVGAKGTIAKFQNPKKYEE
ncbi:MAG TPA: YCF48-related protein [Candidatus Acidoferrum sp.]|nr:YCF48-related protein [Candidatus Acidoferrum sp.]